jgi:hypothetical protein
MTNEDIIRMAREAGMEQDGDNFFSPNYEEMDVHITDLERFAQLVAKHTMANIDPSKFMSYQEGYAAGRDAATSGFCERLRQLHDAYSCASDPTKIRARGQQ